MKNKISKRTLGRTAAQRTALLHNLTSSLLTHGSIVTTRAKAKALVSHAESLIVEGKAELTLHQRRQILKRLGHKQDLPLLVEIAKAAGARTSGHIRLTRLVPRRHDAAEMVRVDIIDQREV